MSGISTGTGLISGIDTASLIDQLMQIEGRPVTTLQGRVQAIDVRRAAYLELSAKLLAVQNAATGMGRLSFFRRFSANSSNEDLITARAGESAVPGSYTFRVRSLVTNHAVVSRGFGDPSSTPVGTGTLSIEVGQGSVSEATALDQLNGGLGVGRGVISITDKSGATAEIDLSEAFTVDDILRAINANHTIDVRASVTGMSDTGSGSDRIVIEDTSGGAGNLIITDLDRGSVAKDLGILANTANAVVEGHDLVRLSDDTPLSFLNDGNGVGRLRLGSDLQFDAGTLGSFEVSLTGVLANNLNTDLRALNGGNGVRLGTIRVTDRSGASADVDLTGATTVSDIIDKINEAEGVTISATVVNSYVLITDGTDVPEQLIENFKIEDVTGHAAADLGIAQDVEEDSIAGREVYRMETMGDLIRAINFATDNNSLVKASVSQNGNGIRLETSGLTDVSVTGVNGSTAAVDLGIEGATLNGDSAFETRHLVAGLNTVLLQALNGGRGVELGTVRLTDRSNQTTEIDFTQAQSLRDVIDLINADTATGFEASINSAGNGIVLRDTSGGTGPLYIEDVTGAVAADLGIAVANDPADPFLDDEIDGGNLQRQYITRNTRLEDLGGGQGVEPGHFRITDSLGRVIAIDMRGRNVQTVGEILDAINNAEDRPATLEARINDTGDGITVIDTSAGEGSLAIEDVEGLTASGLRIAGTAGIGENFIDGTFEVRIDIDAGDTLDDVLRKLNESGGDFSASVLNDGGAVNPYSLTITSTRSGTDGRLVIDAGDLDLGFDTLTEGRDAIVSVGDADTSNPLLIRSSTNTLDDVIDGVTFDLLAAGDEAVTVTVAQDLDGIVGSVQDFVDRYNDVISTIEDATSFDPDTFERGPLLGDRTASQVRTRLQRLVTQQYEEVPESFSRLFSVGIRAGDGGKLEFDEEVFREAYEASPDAVEKLFTQAETGFGAIVEEALESLTDDTEGLLATRNDLLGDQQELLNDRIDSLNILLDKKRSRPGGPVPGHGNGAGGPAIPAGRPRALVRGRLGIQLVRAVP